MSQRVSAVNQTHKMKAKTSERLGLITEVREIKTKIWFYQTSW